MSVRCSRSHHFHFRIAFSISLRVTKTALDGLRFAGFTALPSFSGAPCARSRLSRESDPSALAPRRLQKSTAEVVELVEIAEGEANLAAFAAVPDRHLCPELKTKFVLKRNRVSVDGRARSPRACLAGIFPETFNVSNRQAFGDDTVG